MRRLLLIIHTHGCTLAELNLEYDWFVQNDHLFYFHTDNKAPSQKKNRTGT
jgi:hypothetical protein